MINCSFCDGKATECIEKRDFTYKGEVVNVEQHYYKCNSCSEEFTTDEVDDKTISNLKKEYWKSYVEEGVLFDNVISNLNQNKTKEEYRYMFEHHFIYTQNELKTILSNFIINHSFDEYPDLVESYNEAFKTLI